MSRSVYVLIGKVVKNIRIEMPLGERNVEFHDGANRICPVNNLI